MRIVGGSDDRQAPDPAIVAAAATARYRVQAHFTALHALSPDDAIEYVPPGKLERRQFDKLRERGIIRTAAPGNYWIDLSRLDARAEAKRRRLVPLAIGGSVIVTLLAMLLYQG